MACWAEGIEQVHPCIAGRFRGPGLPRGVLEYLRGLISPLEHKNGWQLAERACDATADGVQRLLSTYQWDTGLWTMGECFEEAKGQVGLDQYEVCRWDGWCYHITLAL